MPDPQQLSVDIPPYLQRMLPAWVMPMWTTAESWRNVVRNQPVAILAKEKLIAYAQALPWTIKAKDASEQDSLDDEIAYYTEWVFGDFDQFLSLIWQDALDLPSGGNIELVRWPPGKSPTMNRQGQAFKTIRPHPLGHVFKIAPIDGATVFPTYDAQYPLAQRPQGYLDKPIFFESHQQARIIMSPRPELTMRGYGMPPPQRIFLAISLLHHGDQYYRNLLSDVPEAGILDLIDMSQKSAENWIEGYKSLLYGIDPQKIGVLYEHKTPAKYIPFGRPPSEMMFNDVTTKYGRIVAAGYWLRLSDLGLEDGARTLAGSIREQREARLTGFGVVKEKTANLINRWILPNYLEFSWVEKDDESMMSKGRARLLNAQALSALIQAGLMTKAEAQQQLIRDGLLSIELAVPEEKPALPQPEQTNDDGGIVAQETRNALEKVPVSQGGRGDVGQVQRAGLVKGDPDMSAVPTDSVYVDQLANVLKDGFSGIIQRASDPELVRLIKSATRAVFAVSEKAALELDKHALQRWQTERVNLWLNMESVLADIPDIQKADNKILGILDALLDKVSWWKMLKGISGRIGQIFTGAVSEGAVEAAHEVREFLYTEDLFTTPDLVLDFKLKNPRTLKLIDRQAADLVSKVNDGTKYYLKRIILSQVDKGLSSPRIAQMIRDGANVEDVLKDGGFTQAIIDETRKAVTGMSEYRTNSIVNTEISRAEGLGRLEQWKNMGLTRKKWVHPPKSPDSPCAICEENISAGFVPMDYMFKDVFSGTLTPPGHPGVCHCQIQFDSKEVIEKAGQLNVWSGT